MSAGLLIGAMLLDAALGEPRWLWSRVPHPAVLMGRVVGWAEAQLNKGEDRRAKGIIAMTGLGLAALLLGWLVHLVPDCGLIEMLAVAILLAQKSLVQHVQAVADAIRLSLGDGRRMVARIVGRDTAALDEPAVARAAIESAAENLSDGVIAPIFWYLVAGLPGLLLYKVTNTADSMIGHMTPRYREFGWAAARFDDLLNLIPARLTAVMIAASHGRFDAIGPILRDAPLHRSPNAGWPEAAMAVSLNVALSGPRSYAGEMRDFPWVYPEGRHNVGADCVDAAVTGLWRSWALMLGFVALIWLVDKCL
jgi:adenosylcobinamide-phosphate synthase